MPLWSPNHREFRGLQIMGFGSVSGRCVQGSPNPPLPSVSRGCPWNST